MSRRSQSQQQRDQDSNDNLTKIASSIGTKSYFLSEQQRNLDQWADRANQIFRYTGEVLKTEYEVRSSSTMGSYANDYEDSFSRCKIQFDAYCILNRKLQKKNDEIGNLANYLSQKNTKRTFFQGWRQYTDRNKYIRLMDERADKYQKHRILKAVMKQWIKQTMDSNKARIKNEVLQKTEIQVGRMQSQYERLIKSLEETLEKKLNELKKEEEEHKLLHDKYQAMYKRAPTEKV